LSEARLLPWKPGFFLHPPRRGILRRSPVPDGAPPMKTATLDRRQLRLAYDDHGTGRPLVLLHAFPLDRRMWQPQLGPLSAIARVLAVDLPGFGDSAAGDQPFTIDSAADAVHDFLGATGIPGRVVLGGLSMGGYVALAFA